MATVPTLTLALEKSDCARSVAAGIEAGRQLPARVVLDTEYPRQRRREPDRRHSFRRAACVRRVGKGKVIRSRRQSFCKAKGVSTMDLRNRRSFKILYVLRKNLGGTAISLDEVSVHGTPRQGLESKGSGSRKEVNHPSAAYVRLENAHPRLTHAIECRSHVTSGRRSDASASPPPRNDAHCSALSMCRRDVSNPRLKAAFSPELVTLQPERDIHWNSNIEVSNAIRHTPADRVELARACRETQLETVAPNEPRRSCEANITSNQYGCWIADTERLEMPEHSLHLLIGPLDCYLQVDPHLRNQILARQPRRCDLVETASERFDVLARDRYSRRSTVSSVSKQQIPAFTERGMQIERGDAPARAFTRRSVCRDKNCGSTELFDDA